MATLATFPARRETIAPLGWALSALSALVGLAVVTATFRGWRTEAAPLAIPPTMLLAAFGAYATPRARAFARREAIDARLDEAGLWLGPRHFVSRDDVSQGFVNPLPGGEWMVRLERWGLRSDLRLVVDRQADGAAILDALGLGVDRHTARFRGIALFHALPLGARLVLLAAPVALQGALMMWAFSATTIRELRAVSLAQLALFPLTVGALLVVAATRTRIDVGGDGVLVRWLGRERFHRHADLVRVQAVDRLVLTGVELELRSGRCVTLPMGTRRLDGGRARELSERIEDARTHATRAKVQGGDLPLERSGRSIEAWLSALRNVGAGANADMRTATVTLESLAAVLLDPSSPPVARAAAAVAAVAADPFEGRARIRVAQATCAHEKLKRALGAVLRFDENDQKIGRALVGLESERA